ncbi:MAG: DUF2079 domain-containing protein [Chloroflexota bacterium]|nr:DUF2079 domain-containing protein [Dehalococcoidia bacterium]MDW8252801.1 DUF2079 domain-containing protein [Chloroflexota bacterium]
MTAPRPARSLRPRLSWRRQLPLLLLAVMVVAFVVFFAALSVHRHLTFGTAGNDLGNMDQAVWNTSQGRWFESTNWRGGTNRLGAHVEPILIPIAALYWIAPTPLTLLVLQAAVVGLGAIPLFWLARRRLGSGWAALPFAGAYLMFPALQAAVLYEFHPLTLTAPFFALAVAGLLERKTALFVAGTVLAVACKEDMPLVAIGMGLYAIVFQRRWWLGGATVALATLWFLFVNLLVIPSFNPSGASPYLPRYRDLGSSVPEIIFTMIFQPWRALPLVADGDPAGYLLALLLPVAFLALLAPEVALLGLPPLAENLVSNSPLQKLPEINHYPAPIVPFMVAAAIVGAARLVRWGARFGWRSPALVGVAALTLLFTLGYSRVRGFTPLAWDFEVKPAVPHYEVARRILRLVPPDASVSATPQLNPHLTQRRQVVVYPRNLDSDVVILDTWPGNVPMVVEDQYQTVRQLLRSGYGLVAAEDGILLLQRGAPNAATIEDSYRNQLREAPPAERAVVRFGASLILEGYTLVPEPPSTPYLVLALRAGPQPNDRDRLFLVVTEGEGPPSARDETWQLPGPTFLPPTFWGTSAFQAMTPTFGRWRRPGRFTVSLVATNGGSPWDIGSRLPAQLGESDRELTVRDGIVRLAVLHADGRAVHDVTPRPLRELPASARRLDTPVGGGVQLAGISPLPAELTAGGELTLDLYWRADQRLERDYVVFLHLVGPEGQLVSQRDGPPASGLRPTTSWQAREIIADRRTLPLPRDLPPGDYQLLAGLYDAHSGERLGPPGADAALAGALRLRR